MGCCPSKPRGAAYASGDESADTAMTIASVEEAPDAASDASSGGASATPDEPMSGPSARGAKRRGTSAPSEEVLLGEEEQEEEKEREDDDAFDEDPRAHLIQAKTTGRSETGDRAQFRLEVTKFSPGGGGTGSEGDTSPAPLALRSPARTPVNYEDMPIASTYHRVLSATLAEREAKRKEEERLEAEQREREVQEYKAAMMLQV